MDNAKIDEIYQNMQFDLEEANQPAECAHVS